ncbi:hypothetical protein [Nioella sp.]|uniref:hypothetical protein n=1 Tax=Nioella sp. TaxID=1912091 RepID=UPI003A8B7E39
MSQLSSLIAGAVIAGLAGSTYYFYTEAQERDSRPPSFGQLAAVNRVVLAEQPYSDSCRVRDDEGLGPFYGEVHFYWSFDFAFGVDIPAGWQWNVAQDENGLVTVDMPALTQLHPHYVEFTATEELENANGDRWQRMITAANQAAHDRIDRTETVMLTSNPEIMARANQSARDFLLPILQSIDTETPISTVEVNFADSGLTTGLTLIDDLNCI